jgi:hypothetical protein
MWWLVTAALAQEPAADLEQLLAESGALLQQGEVAGALVKLADATARWPDDPRGWLMRSGWELASGRFDDLAATFAAAPAAQRDALAPHRALAGMMALLAQLPADHPLQSIDLDAELAALSARDPAHAEFSGILQLARALVRSGSGAEPGAARDLEAVAVGLITQDGASPEALQAACAALTTIDAYKPAQDALAKVEGSPGTVALLQARMALLAALDGGRSLDGVAARYALVRDVPPLLGSPAALAAERFVVDLASARLPRKKAATATELELRRHLAALDPEVPADRPWIGALTLTLASLTTATGDPAAAVSALQAIDLDSADPVAGVVAALALEQRGEVVLADVLPQLELSEDGDTAELAAAWRGVTTAKGARAWRPVAAGAANLDLSVGEQGPKLVVSMVPTVVMVLLPR